MSSLLRKLPLARASPACGRSRSAHAETPTRGSPRAPTPASPGANAPYLDVGPLIYEVQLSRELNPYDVEDSAYLQGLSRRQRRLRTRPGVVRGLHAGLQQQLAPARGLRQADDQRHAGQLYVPVVPDATNQFVYRGRADQGQGAAAGAQTRSPPTVPPRACCCCTRSRSSRSTTGRSSSRSSTP